MDQANSRLESNQDNLEFWDEKAKLLRIISHPIRLIILESLCNNVKCVKDINALITISQPQLSQHVAALRKAKLISSYPKGSLRCYFLTKPTLIKNLIKLLKKDHPVKIPDRSEVLKKINSISNFKNDV